MYAAWLPQQVYMLAQQQPSDDPVCFYDAARVCVLGCWFT